MIENVERVLERGEKIEVTGRDLSGMFLIKALMRPTCSKGRRLSKSYVRGEVG